MRILSWNVNGLKSTVDKGFKENMQKLDEDIICLQETKIIKEIKGFKLEGYYSYFNYSKIRRLCRCCYFYKNKT